MNIILDLRSAHAGMTGIGRYAYGMALSLMAARERSRLRILTSPSGAAYLGRAFVPMLEIVDSRNPTWDDLELPELLHRLRADIYHTPLFVLPSIRTCPTVCTVHDVIPLVRPDLCPESFNGFFRTHIARTLSNACHIVLVSEHSRSDLLQTCRVDPERLSVIPEPVSPIFRPRKSEDTLYLATLGLEPGYLLFVGSNRRRKNLAGLIESYALLIEDRPAAPRLVVVGSHEGEGRELEAQIRELGLSGRARLLGRVSDDLLVVLYANALALVFPSLYEGFGLPVLEAMASGTPVIASNASSIPEVAGESAIMVEAGDIKQLRDAMKRVLDDDSLRRDLSLKGVLRAARFTLERQGKELLRLYRQLAGMG